MFRTTAARLALAAAALPLTLALAACGGSRTSTDTAPAIADRTQEPIPITVEPEPQTEAVAQPTTAEPAPPATVPRRLTPPTGAPAITPATSPPASQSSPATTAAPAPRYAPGQRIDPSSAEVQTAMAALSTRIPMFKPTESQLRTFADAACTSFDQGQTKSQVEATVRQAVTYVQGASLSASDAEFAVRTVVKLRCPGYLP